MKAFANLVIIGYGFSPLESTLIQLPVEVIAAGSIGLTGYLGGRYRNIHLLLIIAVVIPVMIGAVIIYMRAHVSKGVQLFAYSLLQFTYTPLPLLMSLIQTNYKGVTKKMTMTAIFYLAYCGGNVAGSQLFLAREAPLYGTAMKAIISTEALVIVLGLAMRFFLKWRNSQRDKAEGIVGSSGTSGAVAGGKIIEVGNKSSQLDSALQVVELRSEDYEDVSDFETLGFRYRY